MVIAGSGFVKTASAVASALGLPGLRVAEYPGAINTHSDSKIRETLEKETFARIIDGLTKPAETSDSRSEANNTETKQEEIIFNGTVEEVNELFFKNGWTDGLPIVAPDRGKVEEFLKYAGRPPDEGIAVLPQANLMATPRNIAVNAVMAGCRPEHMPILIASVEAISDPEFALINIGTTGGLIPWLLINGPIVNQLGIESGVGLASRGPNSAIGRAFRLIISNIAGFRPGETWMGTWGYFQPFVLAEDNDSCTGVGWQPYHVEHGFSPDVSTVTARPTFNWGPQIFPSGSEPIPILRLACEAQSRVTCPEYSLKAGPRSISSVLITAPTAKVLADGGYSKREVAEYLWHHTRITRRKEDMLLNGFTDSHFSLSQHINDGRLPKWFDTGPDETIPILASAKQIDVIVCGDTDRAKIMVLRGDYNKPVTKEIKIPG